MADETNAGGLTDAERALSFDRYDTEGAVIEQAYSEEDVLRIVAERVRVAVEQERQLTWKREGQLVDAASQIEQERAARLALVAGIEALADEWRCADFPSHLASYCPSCQTADAIASLLSPADTAARIAREEASRG